MHFCRRPPRSKGTTRRYPLQVSWPTQNAVNGGSLLEKIPAGVVALLVGGFCASELLEVLPYFRPCTPAIASAYVKGPLGHEAATATAHYHSVLVTNGGRLFGMDTEPVAAGELREKWRRVVAMMERDLAVVAWCRVNGPCPVAAQKLIDLSAEGAGRSGRARIGLINRAANLVIRPASDERRWGVADHWSDPFETLLSSRGDCEDYAIVKYTALLEAGVRAEDVKIAILKNSFPSEYHAVAVARVNDEWLILDNRTLTLVRDIDVTRATPLFVLDHEGIRRFVQQLPIGYFD
jgi:predicted transglutaminase-like cysteine proteinase